ncbi:MAG TPA: hypothetical protein VFG68_10415 [Fimbriiglobus sp.]|nr:hypothetical protein [Fimbriiglobus sp.]
MVEPRRSAATGMLNVNFSTGGTATLNSDYSLWGPVATGYYSQISITRLGASGKVTFADGEDRLWVRVDPILSGDGVEFEAADFTVTAGAGYVPVPKSGFPSGIVGQAKITLADNDAGAGPTVRVEAQDSVSTEWQLSTGSFRLVRDDTKLAEPLTISFNLGGTATYGTGLNGDYTLACSVEILASGGRKPPVGSLEQGAYALRSPRFTAGFNRATSVLSA